MIRRCVALALSLVGACGPAAAPAPAVPRQLALGGAPGELVDVDAALVPGRVTVVDFWATWCGACEIALARAIAATEHRADIVIRQVDVGDADSPVARHYQIGALPHLRIYGRDRRLRYVLVGDAAMTAGEVAIAVADEPDARSIPN